jgi:putative redox protein
MSREVVVQGGATGFLQRIDIGPHSFVADEPASAGGNDAGPNPYELLLAALGACTSMTLRMYAHRKGWPLESVRVVLTHSRNYAQDCAECEKKTTTLDRIERTISLGGDLSREQRDRLLQIADRCPVHSTLLSTIQISTRLADEPVATR